MRTLSLTMRQAMAAQETGQVVIVLLTISHPIMGGASFRVSSDPTQKFSDAPLEYGTISRGNSFIFLPFSITLPDDASERAPATQIQIENVTRQLVELIRSVSSRATVRIELVLASSPNIVEVAFPQFDLGSVSYNADTVTLELTMDSMTSEPYPSGTFDPSSFPALFG